MAKANASPLDELDQKLIRLLQKDGRRTNRSLAQTLGVTEVTIASRIKRLSDRNLAQVVGILELGSGGFNITVRAGVKVKSARSTRRIAKDIANIEEVRGVSIVDAHFDIFVAIVVRDQLHLKDVAQNKLFDIQGIGEIEFFVISDDIIYKPEWAVEVS